MPTYDYECTKCGHVFEFFQQISEQPKEKCPRCAGQLKRRIGPGAGIIFKGSGFYATDYKKKTNASAKQEGCPKASEGCDACKTKI